MKGMYSHFLDLTGRAEREIENNRLGCIAAFAMHLNSDENNDTW